MADASAQLDSLTPTSHLHALIDQIESILTSPAEFTSSTVETRLVPLLNSTRECEDSDDLEEDISRLEKWSRSLEDATRAAHAKETILKILEEVESWDEWTWNVVLKEIEDKRTRVDEIKRALGELPIEWLKARVTELRKEKELHPPAYLTIHITFSLLPPLSTLSTHLQVYKVRFRVWDIAQTFFSIISSLKSFISVPSVISRIQEDHVEDFNGKLSCSEALALTVEGGLLLDRMIDISVEEKGPPIPDEWIDEFERLERTVRMIANENLEPETPSPNPIETATETPAQSPSAMRRENTRSSLVESVFSMSPSSERLDDSMSSIELGSPERVRDKHDEQSDIGEEDEPEEEEETEFDLTEELRRDDEKIFDKEYHSIATPIQDLLDEIDNSPFLERVIAEMEQLDPFESMPLKLDPHDDDLEDELDPELDAEEVDDDVDVDELYDRLVRGQGSIDEDDVQHSSAGYIRTSSPVFDDQELNYEALESSSDEYEDDEKTTRYDKTLTLNDLDYIPDTENHPESLDPSKRDATPSAPIEDLDETITIDPRSTLSPPSKTFHTAPASLRDSQLHSKVTQIAHSHPGIALIPQHTTFRPTQTSEYGYYTLRPNTSHSRNSSHSTTSESPEPRRVDVGGQNLYVRVLSDRVMVRVGGGWVDLDQYLREYIGKYRRRSGSMTSSGGEYELLDLDDHVSPGRRNVSTPLPGRAGSSLGFYSPKDGRNSSMEIRRSVSPAMEVGAVGHGAWNGATGSTTRRMYVRRK